MKPITKKMIDTYHMTDTDFLCYYYDNEKELNFHHILEKHNGGTLSLSNGAILHTISHRYLHIIQYHFPIIYDGLNYILKEINERGYMPTYEEALIIDDLFRHFEYYKKDALNHDKKPLIRNEFIILREKGLERIRKL